MPLVAVRIQITKIFILLIGSSISLWAADLKPDEIVAKHLDAIGTLQARKNLKSRVVQGAATYRLIQGGSGAIDGKFVFASEGQKSTFLFKVNANGFRGEQFICDGSRTSVAGTYDDKRRSEFGTFVLSQDLVLRENLMGGLWSAGWPLLDLEDRKAKLHSEGLKKIDGSDLIVLRYQPSKKTDLNIFLYFDPQTYRHVMTTYKTTITSGIGLGGETTSAQRQEARYQIEERFSDFQSMDGLTLPNRYDVRYTVETANGFTKSIEWDVKASNILNNQSVDPRSFQVK